MIDVKVDNNGYKWIIPRESTGVLVFDEQDPNNPNDDRSILLNNSNTNMVSNRVNTVEVDLEGDVWVGTDQGLSSLNVVHLYSKELVKVHDARWIKMALLPIY